MRPSGRDYTDLREIKIHRHYIKHPEGSVLVEFGNTKVICNASVTEGVPRFLKGKGEGWLTAEYGMLPRSTHDRIDREAAKGKQGGRTLEIQRLIGRALRSAIDMKALGENTIIIDCDVIQADGGTRTAAITGGMVALVDALFHMKRKGTVKSDPLKHLIAAVSVGLYKGQPILDLDYLEDSNADTDMNIIMTEHGKFIELQGTAENGHFDMEHLNSLVQLARDGINELITIQKQVLGF